MTALLSYYTEYIELMRTFSSHAAVFLQPRLLSPSGIIIKDYGSHQRTWQDWTTNLDWSSYKYHLRTFESR